MRGRVVDSSGWANRANPRDEDISLTAAAPCGGKDLILAALHTLIARNIPSIGQAGSSGEALVAVEADAAQRVGLVEAEVRVLKLRTGVRDAHYPGEREVTLN